MPDPQAASEQPLNPSLLYINGINFNTKQPVIVSVDEVVSGIIQAPENPHQNILHALEAHRVMPTFGIEFGVDPTNLAKARWGIIFHEKESPDVIAALQPLIEHRKSQVGTAGVPVLTFKEGDTFDSWMDSQGAPTVGFIDPSVLPYYLVVAGSPELIPYEFQFLLDLQYGVGRICFTQADGTPDIAAYGRYVKNIINYETATSVSAGRQIAVWATRHRNDGATRLSHDKLILPLIDQLKSDDNGFAINSHTAENASKAALAGLFTNQSGKHPAVIFTASHGIQFDNGDPNQIVTQGGLVTGDWDKAQQLSSVYAAADVADDAQFHGTIVFSFACYSAGTPKEDSFVDTVTEIAPTGSNKTGTSTPVLNPAIAPRPFVSALAQRLLSHPNGGALAFYGHIDEAKGYSIAEPTTNTTPTTFIDALRCIISGMPVGNAFEDFGYTAATSGDKLARTLLKVRHDPNAVPKTTLVADWVADNDAHSYMLLGDPAVRLREKDLT